jgi:outer membrane protein assembly factor BamB
MQRERTSLLLGLATLAFCCASLHADDWPQWLGPQRDGVWRETGLIDKFPKDGPKVKWRVEIGGGYAGPAVAGGKVYVTDRILPKGVKNPNNPFDRTGVPGTERVLCLEEASGKVLWKHEYNCSYEISYPCGPRCTPVVADGKVWTLGAMGDLICFDAETGKVIWSKNLPKDYSAKVPLWGFAAHPLLDGDQLICLVGAKDGVAMSFDKNTGKENWRALSLKKDSSEIGYCPPMIYKVGGHRQLIIWHSEAVCSLDPANGKEYWQSPFEIKANLSIPTPRMVDDKLFITSFYNGCRLFELSEDKPESKLLWKSESARRLSEQPKETDKLHSIMSTPVIKDGHIYGVCSYGELRCLRLSDGKRLWMDLHAASDAKTPDEQRWANAFLVPQGNRWFIFNEKGQLVIAKLSPEGYQEIDRANILKPTGKAMGRAILWSHPAFANKSIYARNDQEIVAVSLAKE